MADRALLGDKFRFTMTKDKNGKDQLHISTREDGFPLYQTRDLGKTLLAIERAHGKESDT